jgi:thiosulfate/3-mercaptopyruvate sulfurtransferase
MVLTVRMDGPIVDVATLAALVSRPDPPTILDLRWRLGQPAAGRTEYAAGHIPGAIFVDLDTELCGAPGALGRHPLPEPGALQAVLRAAGVRAGHPVVVYDEEPPSAARAWWTLRWAGHDRVALLDGGYRAWAAAGQPVTAEVPMPVAGDFTVEPGGLPVLDAAAAATLAAEGGALIDVRVAPRYRGEVEPLDPVAGHIPGAVNLPATEHLGPDGRLHAAARLRERFAEIGVGEGPVGAYCGSGVTAAHTVLALHLAGRTDAALYVGSWSEWASDPSRPVATGEKP